MYIYGAAKQEMIKMKNRKLLYRVIRWIRLSSSRLKCTLPAVPRSVCVKCDTIAPGTMVGLTAATTAAAYKSGITSGVASTNQQSPTNTHAKQAAAYGVWGAA